MAQDATVLAMFADVRGFTKWSEANEVFINLDQFISGFMEILAKRFPSPDYQIKPLGDGAMLLAVLSDELTEKDVVKLLSKVLGLVAQADRDFERHCEAFARRVGHATNLRLGWGIVRGKVIRMGDDWTGHNISKCSRLCDEARPFGLVIDRDDFPELPKRTQGLVAQVRRLRGIGEVAVWVSAEIATQFTPRERIRETPEVHIAGVCLDECQPRSFRLLFARRSKDRRLFPGKLEGCGGQLRYSETFVDGVRRHYLQEFGMNVEVFPELHTFYEIRVPGEPLIPGIRFLCKRVGTTELMSANHSEIFWVAEEKFRNMPVDEFVGNLKREVIDLLDLYKKSKKGIV